MRKPPDRPRTQFKYRGSGPAEEPTPLPPLPPVPAALEPPTGLPHGPESRNWSPLAVAVPLFLTVWVCFGVLGFNDSTPAGADVAALGRVLAVGAAVVALVLLTLVVAHLQVSGRWPRPAAGAVVSLGLAQGLAAYAIGSGSEDLWSVGAWLFVLIGVAVPLAWVGGQFQSGVRRQRVERHASLTASLVERARRQANQTVQSVHRHDVRSMLFVIDGAARALADDKLSVEQRASFGEMLSESVSQLGALTDVRSEEIQPFEVDAVAGVVVQAQRKSGQAVTADLPSPLPAVGRAADVAAVLRTLLAVTGRKTHAGVQLRGEVADGVVVIRVEPQGVDDLPLLSGNWEEISVESFKPSGNDDEESIDLYVAARLLVEQGADLWSTAGRARFAVRLAADSST